MELTKRQRVLNTFNFKDLDRPALYDVLHNIKFIEHVYGKRINSRNAEDAVCSAIAKTFDMVRHFAVPYSLESSTEEDEDGFIYSKSWWTEKIIKRPFKTIPEARELVKKDIFKIQEAIENKRFCNHQTQYNVNLFAERFNEPEELNSEFKRFQDKLDGTVMVAPEFFDGTGPVIARYDYDTFSYLYHDYPELMHELLKTHFNYQLFRIESFQGPELAPVAHIGTVASGTNGLIFSPSFIKKEVFPYVRKIIGRLKEKGYKVIYNFMGDSKEIFDEIINTGPDAFTPVEEISGMSVEWIKTKNPKLVLGFVIDSINVLANGNIDKVINKTKSMIGLSKKYGGIFIGSSGTIDNQIKFENALAMADTVKNFRF